MRFGHLACSSFFFFFRDRSITARSYAGVRTLTLQPVWSVLGRHLPRSEPSYKRVQRVVVHPDPYLPGDLGVAVRDPQRPEE